MAFTFDTEEAFAPVGTADRLAAYDLYQPGYDPLLDPDLNPPAPPQYGPPAPQYGPPAPAASQSPAYSDEWGNTSEDGIHWSNGYVSGQSGGSASPFPEPDATNVASESSPFVPSAQPTYGDPNAPLPWQSNGYNDTPSAYASPVEGAMFPPQPDPWGTPLPPSSMTDNPSAIYGPEIPPVDGSYSLGGAMPDAGGNWPGAPDYGNPSHQTYGPSAPSTFMPDPRFAGQTVGPNLNPASDDGGWLGTLGDIAGGVGDAVGNVGGLAQQLWYQNQASHPMGVPGYTPEQLAKTKLRDPETGVYYADMYAGLSDSEQNPETHGLTEMYDPSVLTTSVLPESVLKRLPGAWYLPVRQVAEAFTTPIGAATLPFGGGGVLANAGKNIAAVAGSEIAQGLLEQLPGDWQGPVAGIIAAVVAAKVTPEGAGIVGKLLTGSSAGALANEYPDQFAQLFGGVAGYEAPGKIAALLDNPAVRNTVRAGIRAAGDVPENLMRGVSPELRASERTLGAIDPETGLPLDWQSPMGGSVTLGPDDTVYHGTNREFDGPPGNGDGVYGSGLYTDQAHTVSNRTAGTEAGSRVYPLSPNRSLDLFDNTAAGQITADELGRLIQSAETVFQKYGVDDRAAGLARNMLRDIEAGATPSGFDATVILGSGGGGHLNEIIEGAGYSGVYSGKHNVLFFHPEDLETRFGSGARALGAADAVAPDVRASLNAVEPPPSLGTTDPSWYLHGGAKPSTAFVEGKSKANQLAKEIEDATGVKSSVSAAHYGPSSYRVENSGLSQEAMDRIVANRGKGVAGTPLETAGDFSGTGGTAAGGDGAGVRATGTAIQDENPAIAAALERRDTELNVMRAPGGANETEVAAGRARQFSGRADALNEADAMGLTGNDKENFARAAMQGQLRETRLDPFAAEQYDELMGLIHDAEQGRRPGINISGATGIEAASGLRQIQEEGRIFPSRADALREALTGEKPPLKEVEISNILAGGGQLPGEADRIAIPRAPGGKPVDELSDEINRRFEQARKARANAKRVVNDKPKLSDAPENLLEGPAAPNAPDVNRRENLLGDSRQLPAGEGGRENVGRVIDGYDDRGQPIYKPFEAPTRPMFGDEAIVQPTQLPTEAATPGNSNPVDYLAERAAHDPGPASAIDLPAQRSQVFSDLTSAREDAARLEVAATRAADGSGVTKADWQAGYDRQHRYDPQNVLPADRAPSADKAWNELMDRAGGPGVDAVQARREADLLATRLAGIDGQIRPPVGPGDVSLLGGENPLRTTSDITPAGDLVLRGQTAADVDLGVVPLAGERRSVAAARRADELETARTKLWNNVVDVINLPRAFKAGFDASATLRQSLPLGASHPQEWAYAFGDQVRAMTRQSAYDQIINTIRTAPLAGLREKAGLFLASAEQGASLGAREEQFLTRLAGKVPFLKASERGYVAMLDSLRSSVFDRTVESWMKQGIVPVEDDLRSLASFINHATGRGTGTALDKAGTTLSLGFFAPRYWASKPQMLGDALLPHALGGASSALVRKEAAKTVGVWLGSMATLGGLAYVAGGKVGVNPLSGAFGQVGGGDYGFDVTGGLAGDLRAATRTITGQKVDSGGNLADADRVATIGRYVRGKLSPAAALTFDLLSGSDYNGQNANLLSLDGLTTDAINTFGNLFMQDAYSSFKKENPDMQDMDLPAFLRFAGTAAGAFLGASPRVDNSDWSSRDAQLQNDPAFGKNFSDLSYEDQQKAIAKYGRPAPATDTGKALADIRDAAQSSQATLEENFKAGKEGRLTIGEYNSARHDNLIGTSNKYEQALKDAGEPPKKDDAYLDYVAIWSKATDPDGVVDPEKFAQLEHEWLQKYPDGYAVVQRVGLEKNPGEVEQARRKAMNQLSADGYWDMPRMDNRLSTGPEKDLVALRDDVSRAMRADKDGLGSLGIKDAIFVYLSKQGVAVPAIIDAQNYGHKDYDSPAFFVYKATHPDLLAWLNKKNDWATIQKIGAATKR